jgi:hypothetical protein
LKGQNKHGLLVLVKCVSTITSFDLWMFKWASDVFRFVINFLGENWMPKHIIINLFEAFKTSRSLQDLLEQYGLTKKILMLKMKVQILIP